MSDAVNVNFTRNQLSTTYDFSKAFRFANSYIQGIYTNDTGVEVVLKVGMVMGRISASAKFKILAFDAIDDSQFPVGICAEDITVAIGATVDCLNLVNGGEVREGALVFPVGTSLLSVIDGRILRDRIVSDTKGIRIVDVLQNTTPNNF